MADAFWQLPRRQRAGGTLVAALAANFGFVALFNDSTLHLLRVINWMASGSGASNLTAFFVQGTVGSLVSRGIATFNQEQDMAGQIYSGTNVTAPPFGVILAPQGTTQQSGERDPWFYVRVGWSLVIKSDTVNQAMAVSLWWEDIEQSKLLPNEII